nr:aldehyde dehydrogenase family protein [Propionibacterium acidifaciens]
MGARPGAGRRQHRRLQALQRRLAVGARADPAHRRGGPPARRRARRHHRFGRPLRRVPQDRRRRRARLHRAHRGRPRHRSGRGAEDHPGHPGAGGKSANIFFDDDPDRAVDGVQMGVLFNQGQVCSAGSRILVRASGPDRFVEVLGAAFSAVRVGDPLDPATQIQMRARINEKRLAKILVYVETGRSEGAEIVTGGSRYGSGPLARGAFMKSTLVLGRNDMRVAREEIFGPAGVITPFEDEVIAMADDSDHGLGGGVFSSDLNRALRVATRARTGRWVNQCNAFPAGAPFGGCKDSGIGRETRTMILDAYQQTKNILVNLGSGPVGLPYGD